MRLLHTLAKTRASFDDPNLISHAGLVPLAALAERARLHDLAAAHVRPDGGRGANAGLKVACLEEIAYRMSFIDAEQVRALAGQLRNEYGQYLLGLLEERIHP